MAAASSLRASWSTWMATTCCIDCPVLTSTHVECNATTADLTANGHALEGAHTLDIYVIDVAGNMAVSPNTFNVVVDNQAPTFSNLSPADGSTILTSSLASLLMQADYSDPAPSSGNVVPMIHVNDSHDGTSGGMIMGCTKTATHYSCPAVKAKRLHLGSNWMEFLLTDKVGNNNNSLPSRLSYYTVVDDVAPAVTGVTADLSRHQRLASTILSRPAGWRAPNPWPAASMPARRWSMSMAR